MNDRLISTTKVNPFDFKEGEQRKKVQKIEETQPCDKNIIQKSQEEVNLRSARTIQEAPAKQSRNPQNGFESTTMLVDRIEMWLQENQKLIQGIDRSKIQNYRSNYMNLSVEKVDGLIYIVDPSQYTKLQNLNV